MKFRKISGMVFIALLTFTLSNCKKKTVDNEVQSVIDNAICEQEFMRIPQIVDARASQRNEIKKLANGFQFLAGVCPSDTVIGDTTGYASGNFTNTSAYPALLLDYGTGCADQADGVTRSGKLSATLTKPYSNGATVVTVTPMNYKAGELSYSGTIKITRSPGSLTVEVTNAKCSGEGWSISWYATRTLTWISGMGDGDETNDVYEITGTSGGVNREGRSFVSNVTTPLLKSANCKWIKKGVIEVTPAELKTRVVDFGDGSCNSNASFTVNGNSYTFNMP